MAEHKPQFKVATVRRVLPLVRVAALINPASLKFSTDSRGGHRDGSHGGRNVTGETARIIPGDAE